MIDSLHRGLILMNRNRILRNISWNHVRNRTRRSGAEGVRGVVRSNRVNSRACGHLTRACTRLSLVLLRPSDTFLMRKMAKQTCCAVDTAPLRVEAAALTGAESVACGADRGQIAHQAGGITDRTGGHANLFLDKILKS